MARILIPLAEGFEDIEAVALIDVLRRGELDVHVHGVGQTTIRSAHGLTVECEDETGSLSAEELDMILLPGGWGGTDVLSSDEGIQRLLQAMDASGKTIGAMCAAPFALYQAGVLKAPFTCYPSVEEKIGMEGYTPDKTVVVAENIMTSRGPGTAICFGLEIVRKFRGEEVFQTLRKGLLAEYCEL